MPPLLPTWHTSCRSVEGGGLEESFSGVPLPSPVLHLQPLAHPCDTMGGSLPASEPWDPPGWGCRHHQWDPWGSHTAKELLRVPSPWSRRSMPCPDPLGQSWGPPPAPRFRTGGWGLRFPSLPGWSRGPLAPSEHDGPGAHQSAFSLTAPRGYGNIPPVPAPAPLDPPTLISPLSGAAPVGAGARPWAGGSFTNVSPAVGLN